MPDTTKEKKTDPLRPYRLAGISLLQWTLILALAGVGLTWLHYYG